MKYWISGIWHDFYTGSNPWMTGMRGYWLNSKYNTIWNWKTEHKLQLHDMIIIMFLVIVI